MLYIKLKKALYGTLQAALLPTYLNRTANTPAAKQLFNVNPEAEELPKTTAQIFHHLVAKLLDLKKYSTKYPDSS